jgi:4-carboxymuconolactone decarboxylase
MNASSDRFQTGLNVQRQFNPGQPEWLLEALSEVSAEFARLVIEAAGDYYSRPGLDLKSRLVATLAALTVLDKPQQLRSFIGFALQAGLTKEEILEVFMQMSLYGGYPAALNAVFLAKEVFSKIH